MVQSKYLFVTPMSNEKSKDDLLREAIANFCKKTAGTKEWNKAFTDLWKLILKFKIPKTSSHPKYPDLLRDIQVEFSQRICTEFEQILAEKKSFVHGLRLWMNCYGLRLGYRIKDLHRENKKKKPIEISLDAPIYGGNNDGNVWTLEEVTAGKIDLIESLIQEDFYEKLSAKIQELDCHSKKYPQCNCGEIARRRLLIYPPQTWEEIANELQVPQRALTSHWHRKCKPRFQQIYQELSGEK